MLKKNAETNSASSVMYTHIGALVVSVVSSVPINLKDIVIGSALMGSRSLPLWMQESKSDG